MKRVGILLAMIAVSCMLFAGCGQEVSGEGVQLVDDDGVNVTYRLKCTECGHLYDQNHVYPLYEGDNFEADILCDYCGENIHVSICR